MGIPQSCLDKLEQYNKNENANKLGIKAKVDYLCSIIKEIQEWRVLYFQLKGCTSIFKLQT